MPKQRRVGLRERLENTLDVVPGGRVVRSRLNDVEDQVMRGLKERLDGLDLPALPGPVQSIQGDGADRLKFLLDRAVKQNVAEAKEAFFSAILDQMVPDEARIIGALSDGSHHALIHVGLGPPVGPMVRVVMTNITNLPRAADVTLLECSRYYVTHLRQLGLLETGPEDPDLNVKYQVLQGDSDVRKTMKAVEKDSKLPVRYLHRIVRLSPTGVDLWNSYMGG